MNTAAVFAVGSFMRPQGGWLLDHGADRLGRKKALPDARDTSRIQDE